MSALKITKERIIKASESCPDAKRVLKELFPEVFEEEWHDITTEIQFEFDSCDPYYFLRIYHGSSRSNSIGLVYPSTGMDKPGLQIDDIDFKVDFKNDAFRILKKW